MSKEKECYTCVYKGSVPGDSHICCRFDWKKSVLEPPTAHKYIKNSWYMFPMNFDPHWVASECEAHSTKVDKEFLIDSDSMKQILSSLK